jgi:hypothetical protein
MNPVDDRRFPIIETVERIIHLTEQLVKFWGNSHGWAPLETWYLLSKSRLDRQASISRQLRLFVDAKNQESGYVILAWSTIGSLTEGLLKLFLAVHYKTYQVHTLVDEIKRIVKGKKGNAIDPDGLMLEKLRQFFAKRVFPADASGQWKASGELNWLMWIEKIQSRRNAIHAFQDREIGDIQEFHSEMQNYLIFLRKIAYALPYPDEVYEPLESPSDARWAKVALQDGERKIKGIIQKGKIKVLTREDGEYLKAALKLDEEVQVINPASVPDWD